MTRPIDDRLIYLDNAATTRVRPEVVELMAAVMHEAYGNPSSRHAMGLAAEAHLRRARQALASRLGVHPGQVLFTSGGTEANALAILGTARLSRRPGHLLVSAVEHPSVRKTADLLVREGWQVDTVPVQASGAVDPDELASRVRPETALVSLMVVNNETGIVQPVAEAARRVKAAVPGCRVHADAVQAFTHLPLDWSMCGVDLLSLSGHKIGGPKGVGALVRGPDLRLVPLWGGGEQEQGLRSGTENVPGIAGFGRAVELCPGDSEPLRAFGLRLEQALIRRLPGAYAVGDSRLRAPQLLAVAVPGRSSEVLVNTLEEQGLCVSAGSACHSRRSLRSHVLEAMGLPREHGIIRLSLGRSTTEAEIARAEEAIAALRL